MAGKPKNISSDGVPNRKGGSWPNHPSMRYELPIPFTPLGPPSDSYRDGWDRIFGGGRNVEHEAGVCGTECPEAHAPPPLTIEISPTEHVGCLCATRPGVHDNSRCQNVNATPVPEAPATPGQPLSYGVPQRGPFVGHYHIDFDDAGEPIGGDEMCYCAPEEP